MAEKLIKHGDVYWVNLTLTEKKNQTNLRELQGRYPTVVVSNDEQNKFSPLITILPLTSQVDKIYPFQIENYLKDKRGIILVDRIRTIDHKRFGDWIDQIGEPMMDKIEKSLHITLTLKK